MSQVPVYYGKWVKEGLSREFVVDNDEGGRYFFLRDGCKLDELQQMVCEDYKLDNYTLVELSYQLPDSMLKQMGPATPHMRVTNDRQVQSLVELAKSHVLRLCVSGGLEVDAGKTKDDGDDEDDDHELGGEFDEDDEEDEAFKVRPDEGGLEDQEIHPDDDDYSKYGKVKGEDEDDDVDSIRFHAEGGLAPYFSEGIELNKGYGSKDELISELRLIVVKSKFAYKVRKSTRQLFYATCRVNGCVWRLRASVKNVPNIFWVTIYSKDHTCSMADRTAQRRHFSSKYVGRLFIDRVGIIDGMTPNHVMKSMKAVFGLTLGYTTSYRALLYAQQLVRGTPEDGYDNLPAYLHLIKQSNPGTVTSLEMDEQNRFKYLFISFGASIAGFRYLRRVIIVDGCHLTGKYGGVLLVAAGQDGNFQIFPLAFGIVNSENDASWEWFFTKLKGCVSDEFPLVIVSDRLSSIKKGIERVFPWATHGICYYHLQCNIVQRFRAGPLMYLVKAAAYAYTLSDFNRYMDQLRQAHPEVARYLEDADVALWSRVHFPGERYNVKTSNCAESINVALKVARGFPVLFLLEFIREKLGRWYCKRREDALSLTTSHSRGVEYLLAVREHLGNTMQVEPIDGSRACVKEGSRNYVVDLENLTCECGVFQTEKIPCSHGIAAAIHARMHISTIVCPSYAKDYLYSAYAANIYPKNDHHQAPDKVRFFPPDVKTKPGRKKKSRWQTWLEIAMKRGAGPRKIPKQYSCSKCKETGHSRQNCKNSV